MKKKYRDYYVTGELQSEGEYISIDKYDDSKSVLDGEYISYYKSGKVEQKGCRRNGVPEGEYTRYKEDGLVSVHAFFKDGKLDGIYTEFSDNGNCTQIEYAGGEPLHDCVTISDKDGYCSKVRLSDKQPIYESPTLSEKQTEYRDGAAWPYYNKNGIMIGMTNNETRDYGKYYQISLVIANNSMFPVEIDPDEITASLTSKKGETSELKVYSSEEYMKKVRRRQNVAMFFSAMGEGAAAAGAGYSESTTTTNYGGSVHTGGSASAYGSGGYAHGHYSGNTTYYGSATTTTTTYDAAAAYQAQVIASERVAEYSNALLAERQVKEEGYLKRVTVYPGDIISGYVNIERKKGTSLIVGVNIHGAVYTFPWNIGEN